MNRKHKTYSKHELSLVNNKDLTAKTVASMTNRTVGAIHMKRTHLNQVKNNKTTNSIKPVNNNINSTIKEINIDGIKIVINSGKINITL